MQILFDTKQSMNLNKNLGKKIGKAGGDALQLLLLLIDKHNSLDASNNLSESGMFYYTKAEAESEAKLLRKRYDSAVKALVAAQLIIEFNKGVDGKQHKYKFFRLHVKNIMELTKGKVSAVSDTDDNDKGNHNNNPVQKEHNNQAQKVPLHSTINKTNSVVVNDDIKNLIILSEEHLTEDECKYLLKYYKMTLLEYNLQGIKNQYGTFDKIGNLVGLLRTSMQYNYTYHQSNISDTDNPFANESTVVEPTAATKNTNEIETITKTMGYTSLTPQLKARVNKWLNKTSIDNVIKAINKTIDMIATPHPAYIDKVLDKIISGTYKETMKNKTKPNFYQDYTQRDYSDEELRELELRLLRM